MSAKPQSTTNAPPLSGPKKNSACGEGAADDLGAEPDRGASIEADLARMWACLVDVWVLQSNDRLERKCAHFTRLHELVTGVCEAADAAGRRRAAAVASSLCFLLDRMVRPDKQTVAAIEEHVSLLGVMFREGHWHDDERGARELAQWLAELRTAAGVAGIAEPSHGLGGG